MSYPANGSVEEKITNLSTMTLPQIKSAIQTKFEQLNGRNVNTNITAIKNGYKTFTKTAGIVKPPELTTNIATVSGYIGELAEFNKVVAGLIPEVSNHTSITDKVNEMGTLKRQVYAARNEKKTAKEDADISKFRKEALEKRETEVSYHQLFGGFTRPLKIMSLPILIAITLFFVSVAIFFIYYLFMGDKVSNSSSGQLGVNKSSQNIMKNLGLKQL